MKPSVMLMLVLTAAAAVAQRHDRDQRDWRVRDQESIKRNFDVSAGSSPAKLLVDNISGFVHVTGYSGREIQVTVEKHIGADSNEAMTEAKRDVKLDMSQQGTYVRLYVDGPFRNTGGVNYRGDDYYGYRVVFDYEIQVPAATELVLKTINYGEILVKNTTGDYEINGLNGGIEMQQISGSGVIRTLNGPLSVSFSKNPTKNTEFRTLNGKMDVYFQPGLDADLNFHTLNGGIFTDFDVTTRPSSITPENVNGKFIYRSDKRQMEARTGKGGPLLTFNALNGAIRLHSKNAF
jgi:hypothetical protein